MPSLCSPWRLLHRSDASGALVTVAVTSTARLHETEGACSGMQVAMSLHVACQSLHIVLQDLHLNRSLSVSESYAAEVHDDFN